MASGSSCFNAKMLVCESCFKDGLINFGVKACIKGKYPLGRLPVLSHFFLFEP
jgi:hypothetical protein